MAESTATLRRYLPVVVLVIVLVSLFMVILADENRRREKCESLGGTYLDGRHSFCLRGDVEVIEL